MIQYNYYLIFQDCGKSGNGKNNWTYFVESFCKIPDDHAIKCGNTACNYEFDPHVDAQE